MICVRSEVSICRCFLPILTIADILRIIQYANFFHLLSHFFPHLLFLLQTLSKFIVIVRLPFSR